MFDIEIAPEVLLVFDKLAAGAKTDSLGVSTDVVFVLAVRLADDATPG